MADAARCWHDWPLRRSHLKSDPVTLPAQLFEAALGLTKPWFVNSIEFDQAQRMLLIGIDFEAGAKFAAARVVGKHLVRDTQIKRYRHLNFLQFECQLKVGVPRVKLPDGWVVQVEPDWAGKLAGYTLLFEALVVAMCRDMTFTSVARIVNLTPYRVQSLCMKYVELAETQNDLSQVSALAIDETSYRRGRRYVTLAAEAATDPAECRVVFVTEGRDAAAIERLASHLRARNADPERIEESAAICPRRSSRALPSTFPTPASPSTSSTSLRTPRPRWTRPGARSKRPIRGAQGQRWLLLEAPEKLRKDQREALDELVSQAASRRTARAWLKREQSREILNCRQPNVVARRLNAWYRHVMRMRVEPMTE